MEWHYIAPGKPMQNGYVESFNVRMRDELLNTGEISQFPTTGHTPSHASVAIRSQGKAAVITGDPAHSPNKFADPEICTKFDFDREMALETREKLINDHADKNVVIFGSHFSTPSAGRIVRDNDTWRFVPLD